MVSVSELCFSYCLGELTRHMSMVVLPQGVRSQTPFKGINWQLILASTERRIYAAQ